MRLFASMITLAAVWMAAPIAAHADPGFVATRAFAYAGPDEGFPRVAYLRRGTRLEVRGCLQRDAWCDVQWGRHRDERGWVNEDVIAFYYRGRSWRSHDYFRFRRPAIVIWDIDRYWDDNYRGDRFFPQRDSFRRLGSHDEHNRNNGARGDRGERGGGDQSQGPNPNEHPRDDHRGDRGGSSHDQNGSSQDQGANDNSSGSDQQHHHGRGQTQSDSQHQTETSTEAPGHHDDTSGSQSPQGQQTGQGHGSQTGTPAGQGDTQGGQGGRHNRDRNSSNNPQNCPLNDQHQPVCPSPR